MAASLSAGVNSLILKLDTPYDSLRTYDIRDDLVKVKVWCSTTSGFTPSDSNLVFDASGLSIIIASIPNGTPTPTALVAGTPYYVKYAFISAIEEAVFTISSQLTATPVSASSQTVDISGFTSFVKADETSFTPPNATLTAVISGITNPVYAWTITGATPTTGTGSTITITPIATNGTGVGVTLSVTGTGLTTPIVKSITIPITYVPPTYYISNYGAVFRRDLDGVIYPASGIVLDSGYSKFRSSPPPTFVWKKDNVVIPGAVNFSYTVPASDYTDSTSHVYTSIATGLDLGGNASSITASVQIPRIDDGPIGPSTPSFTISNYGAVFRRDTEGTVYPSAGISLETTIAAFKSTPAVTYVWKKDDVVISGATSNSYTVPVADYATVTTHKYSCIATGQNTSGVATTLTASVTLPRIDDGAAGISAPSFTISNYGAVFRRDVDGIVYPATGISLETITQAFKSSPAVTYQWRKNGTLITGATSSIYIVPITDYATVSTNTYSCTATGQSTSGVATVLTGSVTLPRIDDGPVGPSTPSFTISNYGAVFRKDPSGTVYPAAGISLETNIAAFKSSPAVTYEWKKNGITISGATASTYTVPVSDYATLTTNTYTCIATGQSTAGVPTVLTANVTLPCIADGNGSTGPRTANGYIYYNTAQAPAPSKPATPTDYNYTTGAFTGLDAAWSTAVNTATPVAGTKVWACSFTVLEPAYQSLNPKSIVISEPFTFQNFTGLVTFTNMNSAFGANVTTIDGGKVTTGTIAADRLDLSGKLSVGGAAGDINAGTTTISGGKITAGSITADRLTTQFLQVGSAAGDINSNTTTINGGKITAGSITADRLTTQFLQVGTAAGDINNNTTTIDGGKITANSITADRLTTQFLQVGSAAGDINSNTTTINGGKITAGSITADRLTTQFLQVGSAAGDINNNTTTINGGKITANSITADRLTTQFLQVGSAAGDINSNTTTINGGKITAGSITADRLDTQFLQVGSAAGDINAGTTTISGGKITAGSITAAKLDTNYIQVGTAATDINNSTTTINGGKITTGSIDAARLSIGNTTGANRIRMYDNRIEIWAERFAGDTTGARRVVLGDLS